MDPSQLDDALIECIDAVLDMLGKNVKHLIYGNWLKTDAAPHRGILGDPEGFARALRELFGIGGASLELLIVREIRRRFADEAGLPQHMVGDFQSLIRQIRTTAKEE